MTKSEEGTLVVRVVEIQTEVECQIKWWEQDELEK